MDALSDLAKSAAVSTHHSIATATGDYPLVLTDLFPRSLVDDANREITHWDGYRPTPLLSLGELAKSCDLAKVYYKDESGRFGLGSFKALGGAYAVIRHLAQLLSEQSGSPISMASIRAGDHSQAASDIVVASATDGNHGRSVAWGAKQAGVACKIYIHRDVSIGRETSMAELGADIIRIDGDYDASVRLCAADSKANGWHVISDTSYEGYLDTPRHVMAGYTVMVGEIFEQMRGDLPTHVFIQAGVGGLAAAVCAAFWMKTEENLPRFIIVESEHAACISASARNHAPSNIEITEETIMAGLSCGETSLIAWEILSRGARDVVTIPDDLVPAAMRLMAHGGLGGGKIEAGECATSGIIALTAVAGNDDLRSTMQLDQASKVLVFGCEGATDADIYQKILSGG